MESIYNIKEIRELYGLSQTDFAKKVRMSRELVSKIENGKCEIKMPTRKKIQRFLENNAAQSFAQDVDYLGQPSQLIAKKPAEPYLKNRRHQKNEVLSFLVPLIGIKAQAGYIKGYEQVDEYIETLDKYSLPPGVQPGGAVWGYFEIDGDSMEPTFSAGDIILASMVHAEDWQEIKNLCVYVILTNDSLLVKRVHRKSATEWVLLSDNEDAYPQKLLPVAHIKEVWTFRRHINAKAPAPQAIEIKF